MYTSILVPIARLLRNFWSTCWSAHDDAVHTQNRDSGLSSQTNGPRFGCQRIHDIVLGSIQCAVCLSLKQKKEKGELQLLKQIGSSRRADLNVDAPRLAVGLVMLGQ
jgi:hypothetical protein